MVRLIHLLHISDLHLNNPYGHDQKIVVKALCDKLSTLALDVIIFSGDLVFSGSKFEGFEAVRDSFLISRFPGSPE